MLHQKAPGLRLAGVDALCPFGGVESLWALLAAGGLVRRVEVSSAILFVGTLAIALPFGRSFCGNVCPLGALQELFARAGRKVFGRRLELPAVLDRPARYLKYAVLAVFSV